jgi:hypothetical protein
MLAQKSSILMGVTFCLLLGATHLHAAQVRFSWHAPTTNADGTTLHDLAGYRLHYGLSSRSYPTSVNVGTTTSYTLTGLTTGQRYYVAVTASDTSGNRSAYSTEVTFIAPTDPSGLVAAYDFDQGSGSTLTDVSGKGHHGTISGAVWISSGKYGKALVFDGVNDYVRVSDSAALDLTTHMTFEAWVYPTALQSGQRPAMTKDGAAYFLRASSTTGTLRPSGGVTLGSTIRSITAPNAIPVKTWSHLAVTYNGSTLRLYVNGTQVASSSVAGTIKNGGALRIGGDSVKGQYFRGRMDDARLYNRALTATEIRADMNNSVKPMSSSALMAEGSAVTPADGILQSALAQALPPNDRSAMTASGFSPRRSSSDARSVTAGSLTADHLETAEVTVDQQWKRVEFKKSFTDPIVVAKALSFQDAAPVVVRIRRVDAMGFDVRVQSWQDADRLRQPETAGYLVFERGRYTLADGISIEAGSAEVDRQHAIVSLDFSQPFRVTPVVMTAVSSTTNGEAVIGRPSRIRKQGFQFRFQPQESATPEEATETVSYVAWEPSSGTIDGLAFEVDSTLDIRRDRFHTLVFSEVFADAPIFLADIQATGGGRPLNVRWNDKDLDGIEVKIDEAPSNNGVAPVVLDLVGYIAIQ